MTQNHLFSLASPTSLPLVLNLHFLLQFNSFSKPFILVGNPDPTLILTSLNFPHQFDFPTCYCSKQDKQPMANKWKPAWSQTRFWVSQFFWQLEKTFAVVALWAGSRATPHSLFNKQGSGDHCSQEKPMGGCQRDYLTCLKTNTEELLSVSHTFTCKTCEQA